MFHERSGRRNLSEISKEPIRILLKEHNVKPWKKKDVVHSRTTDEFIERMMDILEIYERPYNSREPVICLDEKSKQLLAHTRGPLPVKSGAPERYDSEYERKGTANIFVMVEPKAGRRHTIVRKYRRYNDYSLCLYFLSKLMC